MKRKCFFSRPLLATAIFLSLPDTVLASGFQLFEMATPSTATAGVGQAAYASDASTAFLNPAGMARLNNNQLLIGSQLFFPNNQFARNVNNTIPGGSGEKNDLLVAGASIYYVNPISERLKLGFSLASPYGGIVDYGNQWAGRYLVQNATLLTLNLNPSFSYTINDLIAVGGGFSVQYAALQEKIALPLPGFFDGQVSLKLSDYSPGFNLGVLLTPFDHTRIGVAYRSQINQKLSGHTYFNRLNATPPTSAKIITPNSLIASLYQGLNESFALVAEGGWTNWQKFENTVVQIQGFTTTIPRHWKNTYRLGIGGEFKIKPQLALMSGFSYDSSPINTPDRLPDFPLDRQLRFGVGALYTNQSQTQFGFQYEFVDYGSAKMNQVVGNQGVFAGSLRSNYGQFVSLTMNATV